MENQNSLISFQQIYSETSGEGANSAGADHAN